MNLAAAVCYAAAALLLSMGAAWFSMGAGLIVAGLCVVLFTTFGVLEVGARREAD